MELRNCPACGRVYAHTGRPLCPDCVAAEEEEFKKVSDYLRDYRSSSLARTSEATGVRESKILRFLREGRLMGADGAVFGLLCEKCGEPVTSGRWCPKCASGMSRQIESAIVPRRGDGRERMHYSGLWKKGEK